jgi:integrase
MARKKRGWLRKKLYSDGITWLWCYMVRRQPDEKGGENHKRVGLLADFPDEQSAWAEVGRLGLSRYLDNPISPEPTFRDLAEHWRVKELRKSGVIRKKAAESADRDEHNLDRYVLPRWGMEKALEINPVQVEDWFETLASTPQGRKKEPLNWRTIEKLKSVMSQVFTHAQRHCLIPAALNPKGRPTNPCLLARCSTSSDYEARVVEPEQMIAILRELNTPETLMEWTLALVHSATALRPEEAFGLRWEDVNWARNRIHVRRGWSKGEETNGKTPNSLCPVAMHQILAQYLAEWRKESLYPSDSDWVFPSYRCKGKVPRSASTCGKKYLRPAAVTAGVIKAGESVRFGWHNLRHSLATFFGSQEIPVQVIQKMLRQKKLEMTLHYMHGVNQQHMDAQKLYLDAIGIGGGNLTSG